MRIEPERIALAKTLGIAFRLGLSKEEAMSLYHAEVKREKEREEMIKRQIDESAHAREEALEDEREITQAAREKGAQERDTLGREKESIC